MFLPKTNANKQPTGKGHKMPKEETTYSGQS
jgi:hypothetical protein